jgi:hypothetical protein
MKRHIITVLLLVILLSLYGCARTEKQAGPPISNALGFETHAEGTLDKLWALTPEGSAQLDLESVYEGEASARVIRTATSEGDFSSIGFKAPITSPTGMVTLRAAVKVDEIMGMASLWARQDNATGRIAYTNLRQNSIRAEQDWTVHELEMAVDPKATSISVGIFLAGTGRINVDNFELLLDGQPLVPSSEDETDSPPSDFEFASGSRVNITTLTNTQAESLSVFVKVWGFLKYHHPTVASGNVDWDAAFLRALPNILSFETASDRNAWLNTWVKQIGEIDACDPCAMQSDDPALAASSAWIEDTTMLGEDLSAQLIYVRTNRISGDQYYVKSGKSGQAEFVNEPSYSIFEETDSGFRLLAVARYWNMIQYWFPYRDIIPISGDTLLENSLNDVVESRSERDYQLAMTRLIAGVQDTHAKLGTHQSILPPVGTCDLPLHIRFIEDKPMVVALRNPLSPPPEFQIGDVILRIDGQDIADLLSEMRPLYAASNTSAQNRDMALAILRGDCGPTEIEVEREGQTLSVSGDRVGGILKNALSLPRVLSGETAQMLEGDIGYIKLSSVKQDEVPSYIETIRNAYGLIIDIRTYPSDFMPFELGQWFADAPTPFVTFTVPSFETPGEFVWLTGPKIPPVAPDVRLDMPIVILVDEVSQSSAEYTAMAFQALPNAIVVGSQTAGADGNISRITLPGNLGTVLSGIGVFYPDGRPTQQIGIVPDIEVRPTRAGIIEGRDEVLEIAIEALRETQSTQ